MATPINMLVLDGEGLAALANVLSELPSFVDLLSRVMEGTPAADTEARAVTRQWAEHIAEVSRNMAGAIVRCNHDYAWLTEQINADNTLVPTPQ